MHKYTITWQLTKEFMPQNVYDIDIVVKVVYMFCRWFDLFVMEKCPMHKTRACTFYIGK